jgi:thiosulfate reductase/polysulfide reductase chain A
MAMLGSLVLDDIGKTACLVLWGSNPKQARLTRWKKLKKRVEKKATRNIKIIVVDPIINDAAQYADMCLQIRPGTDAALALGWIHIIVEENLYDKEFVGKWTYGFEEVAERVARYPPRKVAEITGLSVEDILESARMYATNHPACIDRGVAADQLGLNSTRVEQARIILAAITGNIDVPGGDFMSGFPVEIEGKKLVSDSELELLEICAESTKAKQIGAHRFKLMSWASRDIVNPYYQEERNVPVPSMHYMIAPVPLIMRQILTEEPYPLKAMICAASNPVVWAPNTPLVVEALSHPNLELSVVLEYWMTPTAQLADYVLPAASWLERPLCSTAEDWVTMAFAGEKAVEPLGDRHEDYQFWRALGIRLGQKKFWPWKDMEEVIKHRISPLGISYEDFIGRGLLLPRRREFRKFENVGFATSTGKIELYSTVFEKLGYDPLPYYEEPPESPIRTPELLEKYPLILNTGGRFMPQFHSEHRQWGMGLRETHPDPLITIHSETAGKLGIQDGDWIYIETRRGKIRQRAKLTKCILPNVVNVEASWWFPEKRGEFPSLFGVFESNANVLTIDDPDSLDPLTGGWCNRAMLCKVYKAEDV